MKQLEKFTLKQVADYIVDKEAEKLGISKTLARKLFINALSYNVVVEAIEEQMCYLMDEE